MISIIVPVYNEEEALTSGAEQWKRLSARSELIFADGGSTDRSEAISQDLGAFVRGPRGRAPQMNTAAAVSRGEILLFLHADTMIDPCTLENISRAVKDRGYAGGCLTQRIKGDAAAYRLIEAQGNIRARLSGVYYGDQGIFVKRDIFSRMGGFPEVSVMEDVLFSRKMRKTGTVKMLRDRIFVSNRRWAKRGMVRTTLMYSTISLLFCLGVSTESIKNIYEDVR
ncbi:MAG: glycosyltransferase [Candidatus Omnitrophica bacterium]|nr:glycosyltransferase [Candidatus Omnitrophota bacterium]